MWARWKHPEIQGTCGGIKQGGQVWYKEICQTFQDMGYMRTSANYAVFICTCDNIFSMIVLYTDDLMLGSTYLKAMLEDKDFLMKHYPMTDLGEDKSTQDCRANPGVVAAVMQSTSSSPLSTLTPSPVIRPLAPTGHSVLPVMLSQVEDILTTSGMVQALHTQMNCYCDL